jgi:hypothetical protein
MQNDVQIWPIISFKLFAKFNEAFSTALKLPIAALAVFDVVSLEGAFSVSVWLVLTEVVQLVINTATAPRIANLYFIFRLIVSHN